MILTPADRFELLQKAWDLRRAHEYAAIAELLAPLELEEFLAEPELGHLGAESFYLLGDWERSLALIDSIAEPVRRRGDEVLELRFSVIAGNALLAGARLNEAEPRFWEVLERAQEVDDELHVADASASLGIIADIRGEWDRALSSYRLALTIYQRVGRAFVIGGVHHNLGMTYRQTGDFKRSEAHFDKAMHIAEKENALLLMAACDMERALLLNQMGDHRLAEVTALRARRRFLELGHRAGQGDSLRVLGMIAAAQGKLAEARRLLTEGLLEIESASDDLTRAEFLEEMAVLDLRERHVEESSRWAEEAVAIYRHIGSTARVERLRRRLEDAGAGRGG